jgi:ribosomal protein S18 acetylase RimI-like enzyme
MAGHADIGEKGGIRTIVIKSFRVRPLDKDDRAWVAGLLKEAWAGPVVVSRGKLHRADRLPGFVAVEENRPAGLITCRIDGKECEIVTMNSLDEGKGIGTALIEAVKDAAARAGCRRLWLITTNDNTKALRFYQKRGFSLAAVHRNAVEASRKLKPEIPLTGNDGIPIRDEIEMELLLATG